MPVGSGGPHGAIASSCPLRLRIGAPSRSSAPAHPSTRAPWVSETTGSGTPSRRRRLPSSTAPRPSPPCPLALPAPTRSHAPVVVQDGGALCLNRAFQTAVAFQARTAGSHQPGLRTAFPTPRPPEKPRLPASSTVNPPKPAHTGESNTIVATARGRPLARSSHCRLTSTRNDSYSLGPAPVPGGMEKRS